MEILYLINFQVELSSVKLSQFHTTLRWQSRESLEVCFVKKKSQLGLEYIYRRFRMKHLLFLQNS